MASKVTTQRCGVLLHHTCCNTDAESARWYCHVTARGSTAHLFSACLLRKCQCPKPGPSPGGGVVAFAGPIFGTNRRVCCHKLHIITIIINLDLQGNTMRVGVGVGCRHAVLQGQGQAICAGLGACSCGGKDKPRTNPHGARTAPCSRQCTAALPGRSRTPCCIPAAEKATSPLPCSPAGGTPGAPQLPTCLGSKRAATNALHSNSEAAPCVG